MYYQAFSHYRDFSVKNNLVDPASSDMLVSKIKPCKCKFKSLMKLRRAYYNSQNSIIQNYMNTNGNSVDNTCSKNIVCHIVAVRSECFQQLQ